jgi:tetratricopeptide (TPR) repeat protein
VPARGVAIAAFAATLCAAAGVLADDRSAVTPRGPETALAENASAIPEASGAPRTAPSADAGASSDDDARRAADDASGRAVDDARALIRRASADQSTFYQVTSPLRAMGDAAVPALIEARGSPALKSWATDQLEAIGKRSPGDAVQIGDSRILCEVLAAYGATKDMDALPAVLAFIGADRPDVRDAARASVVAYGERASHRLADAVAAWSGGSQAARKRSDRSDDTPKPSAAELAARLFDASDRHRLVDIATLMDRGVAAADAGAFDQAVGAFDEALARQPSFDRRAEAAPSYAAYAESIEALDADSAETYYMKAIRLDPESAAARRARSRLEVMEGIRLRAGGILDPDPFVAALALDPRNDDARAELDRQRAEDTARHERARRVATGTLALGVALAAVAGIALARRRRPS